MERITRIAPRARLEEQITELLTGGLGEDGASTWPRWIGWERAWCCSELWRKKLLPSWPSTVRADTDGDRLAQRDTVEADPDRRGRDEHRHGRIASQCGRYWLARRTGGANVDRAAPRARPEAA